MHNIYIILFTYLVIVLSAVFHEYAHALVAYILGDDTAQRAGRLTLNPIVHLDMFGTVLIPLMLLFSAGTFIGWARPVPYNPFNLRDKKYGSLKVALAGPVSNILIALVFGVLIRLGAFSYFPPLALELAMFVAYANVMLALFNLIPVPPLDGSKILYDLFPRIGEGVMRLGMWGMVIALFASYYVLGPVARVLFELITGVSF